MALALRFGILEWQNPATQNVVIVWVTMLIIFSRVLLLSYKLNFVNHWISLRVTNSKVKLLFFYFRATNCKKNHLELLTRWCTNSMVKFSWLNGFLSSCKIVLKKTCVFQFLTLSWRRSLSCRNQFIDLQIIINGLVSIY